MTRTERLLLIGLSAVGVLIAVFFVWFLSGWKGTRAQPSEKETILRFNPPVRFAGVLMLALAVAFPTFLAGLLIFSPAPKMGHIIGIGVFGFAIAVLGVYVGREIGGSFALISDEGVSQWSPWWGGRQLYWRDVERVEVHPNKVVVLFGKDGSRMTFAPIYWAGLELLNEAIEKNVEPEIIVRKSPF